MGSQSILIRKETINGKRLCEDSPVQQGMDIPENLKIWCFPENEKAVSNKQDSVKIYLY